MKGTQKIEDALENPENLNLTGNLSIVIDRFRVAWDGDTRSRIADSVETAFYEGNGECLLKTEGSGKRRPSLFSTRFEWTG
jgi:excinuclease ABC subunit A